MKRYSLLFSAAYAAFNKVQPVAGILYFRENSVLSEYFIRASLSIWKWALRMHSTLTIGHLMTPSTDQWDLNPDE